MFVPDPRQVELIDACLKEWRQGDFVHEASSFTHIGTSAWPLTDVASKSSGDGFRALTVRVRGLVLVTQTCDIVRSSSTKPYVDVAPLVAVDNSTYHDVRRGRRSSLTALSRLESEGLVVDLDRIMTVEKSVVMTWTRTPGCMSDAERVSFAQALVRKFARFAFPDEFTTLVRKLHSRLTSKHDKATDEGRGLRALREIRVGAKPSWDTQRVELTFWFIRDGSDSTFEGERWEDLRERWQRLVEPTNRFPAIRSRVVHPSRMSVEDYLGSVPLDLDHLTTSPD